MKVTKFGGSSLANATQIKKVFQIIQSDTNRRFVIVSAPGKRTNDDTKVTDALIQYYNDYIANTDVSPIQEWIINRYQSIADELDFPATSLSIIRENILALASLPIKNNPFLYDHFLAAGEDNNALLIAEYFTYKGLPARYIHPQEAGLFVTPEPGNAQILPLSYDKINNLKDSSEILIIPGFFGVTLEGNICTFSRGGSDITGSIVAAGVQAELYENFTDVNGIFAAHPGIVQDPHSIKEITYREMRELAYAGFTVLHDEALLPAYRGQIPVVIKNTNNPTHPGTRIVLEHSGETLPVVGIAADDDFASINVSKYLMNREIGFGRKLLQILEELDIRWEHMPTGIDDLSVVIRSNALTPQKEKEILERLYNQLEVDKAEIEGNLSIIMIVGEKMKSQIGVAATATAALSNQNINLAMISQGASEVSVMFVVTKEQRNEAIRALYNAFFLK